MVGVVVCVRLNQLEFVKLNMVVNVVYARSLQKVAYRWVPIKKWNFQIITSERIKGLVLKI